MPDVDRTFVYALGGCVDESSGILRQLDGQFTAEVRSPGVSVTAPEDRADAADSLAFGRSEPHISAMAPDGATALAAGVPRLAVTQLALSDFRCYAAARMVALDERPVVLTGPNGAGKTNLLEAVSFLAPGRGLRRARLGEIDRRRPPGAAGGQESPAGGPWAVAATLSTEHGAVRIGTGRDAASDSGERRIVRIDGAPARAQTALADHLHLVWLTPAMDRLFTEGTSGRRRFLDRLAYGFDAAHAGRVAAYEHALRERGRLLRERGGAADSSWLSALEGTMAEHGVAITAARRETVARLDEACAAGVGPFPRARLALEGAVEAWLDEGPALAAEERFRASLAERRRIDAEAGATILGPHRSDLVVTHGGNGRPAAQCSTGEQKALLIAILLAHARLQRETRGAPPVMLLDEVAAHLDAARRRALFEEILALGAQAWMTGTDEALFSELRGSAQFFHVADATIAPSASPPAGPRLAAGIDFIAEGP